MSCEQELSPESGWTLTRLRLKSDLKWVIKCSEYTSSYLLRRFNFFGICYCFNARLYVHLPRLGSRRRSKTTIKTETVESEDVSKPKLESHFNGHFFLHESGLAACLLYFPSLFTCRLSIFLGQAHTVYVFLDSVQTGLLCTTAPCSLWGCKNRPAPFPGRMS